MSFDENNNKKFPWLIQSDKFSCWIALQRLGGGHVQAKHCVHGMIKQKPPLLYSYVNVCASYKRFIIVRETHPWQVLASHVLAHHPSGHNLYALTRQLVRCRMSYDF